MRRNVVDIVFNIAVRICIVAVGFVCISGAVYLAGIWLVPSVDATDKAIAAVCNPDAYVPILDEFIRALTDYTNFIIAAPLISWMVAYGLYRLVRRWKSLFTGLLVAECGVVAVFAALDKIWPNSTYHGVNVLLVLSVLAGFGAAAALFHGMSNDAMRRFSRLFWLVLLSSLLTSLLATTKIKEWVARPRPLNEANKPWNEQLRTIPDEVLTGCNSFPSGHTSGTFALLTPFFWYVRNRKGRAGLLAWGVLQGFARVYTAAHFPFCCLMGGLLGFANATLVFFVLGGPSLRGPLEATTAPANPLVPQTHWERTCLSKPHSADHRRVQL